MDDLKPDKGQRKHRRAPGGANKQIRCSRLLNQFFEGLFVCLKRPETNTTADFSAKGLCIFVCQLFAQPKKRRRMTHANE